MVGRGVAESRVFQLNRMHYFYYFYALQVESQYSMYQTAAVFINQSIYEINNSESPESGSIHYSVSSCLMIIDLNPMSKATIAILPLIIVINLYFYQVLYQNSCRSSFFQIMQKRTLLKSSKLRLNVNKYCDSLQVVEDFAVFVQYCYLAANDQNYLVVEVI